MGNSDEMFRQLMSDLKLRMNTNWRLDPDQPDDGSGRMQMPAGPAVPPVLQVPERERQFVVGSDRKLRSRVDPDYRPPTPEPDPRLSRSGGYAPQERSHDEMLAYRDRINQAIAAQRQTELSPFQMQRQEMRNYKVVEQPRTPEENAARDQAMLQDLLRQNSSASGGHAPQEPAPPPDWKARLDDLQRRARELKGDFSVTAPAGMKKPPKGDLI